MKLFEIRTDNDIAISENLDQNAPAIRLHEGKVVDRPRADMRSYQPENGPPLKYKAPLDLDLHEQTRVRYPLLGGSLEVTVTRTE